MTSRKMEDEEETTRGCEHYARRCAFVAPCCNKIYTCRICHDEAEATHEINRHAVLDIKCLDCETIQPVADTCKNCGVKFAKYFCSICRLYDDKEKGQFHCDPCGICRVGGRENFYHCPTCDMCLTLKMKDSHKCVEKASHANCPVCMNDLHSSREPIHVPKCTHLVHRDCYHEMLRTGNYACPVCGESTVDMMSTWLELDREIENTPMPDEYKDFRVQILCKDCHKESRTLFHVIGMKCQECGSYNTCRAAEPDPHPSDEKDTSTDASGGASNHTTETGAVGGEGVTTGLRVVTHPSDEMEESSESRAIITQPSDAQEHLNEDATSYRNNGIP